MPRVLYVSYWGALEQLGQSLVIPAIKKLAQMGADLTLITFEKPTDLARSSEMKRIREILAEDRIDWIPLKYHKDPKIPATIFDIAHGIARSLQKRLTKKFDIVHARTYPGGLMGLAIAPLIGAKFVYHNEGFYPDEQVDCGVWAENSRPHRIAKRLENLMYSRADGIIALSNRSKEELEKLSVVSHKKTPVIVVPSCVDLDKFKLPEAKPKSSADNEISFVYIGSIGGRYILDEIGRFILTARKANKKANLQIYSKADYDEVKKMLVNVPDDIWSLRALANDEVPTFLAKHHVGIHFLRSGISEHTGSPTKIGEYWAVGLPVVITSNMSDNDTVVKNERVGVVLKEHNESAYLKAFEELQQLLKDPDLSKRCRKAAENHYALIPSCERQFALYQQLIEN
jgi:glycosyltransferase involved in cell wall biosynthesis